LRRELLGELAAYVTSSNARAVALEDKLQEDMQRFSQLLHSLEKQVQLASQSVKSFHGCGRGSTDGTARSVSQREHAPAELQVPENEVQVSTDVLDKKIMDAGTTVVHVPASNIDQSSIEPSPLTHPLHDGAGTVAAPAHATCSPCPVRQPPKEGVSCAALVPNPRPHHPTTAAGAAATPAQATWSPWLLYQPSKEAVRSAPPLHKQYLFPPSEQRSVIPVSADSLDDTIRIDELMQCASKLQQPADIPQPVASVGRYMAKAGTNTLEKIGSARVTEEVSETTNSESLDTSSSSSLAMKDKKRVRFASEHRGKGGGIVDGVLAHTPSDSSKAGEAEMRAATHEDDSERAVSRQSVDRQSRVRRHISLLSTEGTVMVLRRFWPTLPQIRANLSLKHQQTKTKM